MERTEILEIAKEIRKSDTWDMDLLQQLCEAADLGAEWKEADGDTFESVVYKAAEILDVEIF